MYHQRWGKHDTCIGRWNHHRSLMHFCRPGLFNSNRFPDLHLAARIPWWELLCLSVAQFFLLHWQAWECIDFEAQNLVPPYGRYSFVPDAVFWSWKMIFKCKIGVENFILCCTAIKWNRLSCLSEAKARILHLRCIYVIRKNVHIAFFDNLALFCLYSALNSMPVVLKFRIKKKCSFFFCKSRFFHNIFLHLSTDFYEQVWLLWN